MRKDRISVALTKDIIKAVEEAAKRERRSRSAIIQLALEKHFQSVQPTQEARSTEIPIKLG